MNPSYQEMNQYNSYLEAQIDKFSSFMLTQKKLNEKHLQLEKTLQLFQRKILNIEQKIIIIQINQKDNLLEIRKIKVEKQNYRTVEIRLQNMQNQLKSILNCDSNKSQGDQPQEQIQNSHSQNNSRRNSIRLMDHHNLHSQKVSHQTFLTRIQVEQMINSTRNELQFKIKKIQLQSQKSKESFLKLTSHINNLTISAQNQNGNKNQLKNQNRMATESTRDINIDAQQNIITKKQFKKMEKKLENFFSQKLSQMTIKSHRQQSQNYEKGLKFKKMQEKYDRMTTENNDRKQNISLKQINSNQKRHHSLKKISLFDNQMLRGKQIQHKQRLFKQKKQKNLTSRSKEQIQSPIDMIQSPKNKRKMNSEKSKFKKNSKEIKSIERLRRVNLDYMMQ